MPHSNARIVVVGAGALGTQCANSLQTSLPDAAITILDRNPDAYDGASSGNMGGFATCEVQPLARPANLLRAAAWATDPLAPFTMRLRYIADYLPWVLGFIKSALTPGHFAHVISAQKSLMMRACEAHLDTIDATPLRDLVSEEGAVCIYRTGARMQRDWDSRWRLFRAQGAPCEILSAEDLRKKLPDLDSRFQQAVYLPTIRHWKSPAALLRGLHGILRQRQVSIQAGNVTDIKMENGKVRCVQLADSSEIPCDFLVVAAGVWSRSLCTALGDNVPLDTERGYTTTLPNDTSRIRNLLLFPDDEFVATPMQEGLRIGGTVELAGLRAPPNFRRTSILVHMMKQYFPGIDISDRTDWMGFRPSIPDGLPVIGGSPGVANAFYAFGHGHVGVTQSAITGRLIAQSLCGQPTDVDLRPFSIARFRK
jgi:D-amino-acid dehydrogenase